MLVKSYFQYERAKEYTYIIIFYIYRACYLIIYTIFCVPLQYSVLEEHIRNSCFFCVILRGITEYLQEV